MTLVEESAMKQSTTGRHCEERSDEAIQKSTTFWMLRRGAPRNDDEAGKGLLLGYSKKASL
jgi:hypothetical protein